MFLLFFIPSLSPMFVFCSFGVWVFVLRHTHYDKQKAHAIRTEHWVYINWGVFFKGKGLLLLCPCRDKGWYERWVEGSGVMLRPSLLSAHRNMQALQKLCINPLTISSPSATDRKFKNYPFCFILFFLINHCIFIYIFFFSSIFHKSFQPLSYFFFLSFLFISFFIYSFIYLFFYFLIPYFSFLSS